MTQYQLCACYLSAAALHLFRRSPWHSVADSIPAAIESSVAETATLLFGAACPVHFPMHTAVVGTYADAK